jgi:hypothetical protein
VLVDGRVRATWVIDRDPTAGAATLQVDHLGALAPPDAAAVEAEGMALLRFATDGATDVDRLQVRFRELG